MAIAVLRRRDQFQVFDPVIQSVVIDVMNVLSSPEWAPYVLLHHPPVFQEVPTIWRLDLPVPRLEVFGALPWVES